MLYGGFTSANGFTPLMEAVAQNQTEAVKLLVSLGATPIANDGGDLPSEHARLCGNLALAEWLAENGF